MECRANEGALSGKSHIIDCKRGLDECRLAHVHAAVKHSVQDLYTLLWLITWKKMYFELEPKTLDPINNNRTFVAADADSADGSRSWPVNNL